MFKSTLIRMQYEVNHFYLLLFAFPDELILKSILEINKGYSHYLAEYDNADQISTLVILHLILLYHHLELVQV